MPFQRLRVQGQELPAISPCILSFCSINICFITEVIDWKEERIYVKIVDVGPYFKLKTKFTETVTSVTQNTR